MAVPSPPPMQIAAMPRLRFRASRACNSVTIMRAPDAPIGCPNAQAPPFTFNISRGMFKSCMNAIGTTAKASFTSQRSTSSTDQPIFASSFCVAGTGAVVNRFGACAWLACPMIRARDGPSVAPSQAITRADAPSDMLDAFAAVTVPFSRKAGLSLGILSGRAALGCSSESTTISDLRDRTVTGAISRANPPPFCAAIALERDVSAKSSWAIRVNW